MDLKKTTISSCWLHVPIIRPLYWNNILIEKYIKIHWDVHPFWFQYLLRQWGACFCWRPATARHTTVETRHSLFGASSSNRCTEFVLETCDARWWETYTVLLLMEEILHHLGWLNPYKSWNKLPINWCRISSIHSRGGKMDEKRQQQHWI